MSPDAEGAGEALVRLPVISIERRVVETEMKGEAQTKWLPLLLSHFALLGAVSLHGPH